MLQGYATDSVSFSLTNCSSLGPLAHDKLRPRLTPFYSLRSPSHPFLFLYFSSLVEGQSLLFFCHAPEKWGYGTLHSKKWGLRVPFVAPPSKVTHMAASDPLTYDDEITAQ